MGSRSDQFLQWVFHIDRSDQLCPTNSAEAWAGIYDSETNELLAEGTVLLIDVRTQQFDSSKLNELGWKVYPE